MVMLQAEQIVGDRYQLKQPLGQNSGRQTWLAEDLSVTPPEPVVVKLLAFGGEVQWDDLKLFEREAQTLRQLNHPCIPKYRDYFNIDDRTLWFGLVQEYIPGDSLRDLLNQGHRFSEKQIRQFAKEILKILIYLHSLNPPVLHRDIKPSNLILGKNNQIYLVDFGAVQAKIPTEGSTFTIVGTYGYAPVEQFGGKTVPASDLYALGASLIHLLTGASPAELPQKNMQIQFAASVSVSKHLIEWLQKITEPALENRFQSAREALNALKTPPENKLISTRTSVLANTSGSGSIYVDSVPIPDEIKGWNWGAFLLPWFWVFGNKVWLGLLIFAAWPMAFVLGAKGNEWAWKSRRWDSISQFKQHQRNWTMVGVVFWVVILLAFSLSF